MRVESFLTRQRRADFPTRRALVVGEDRVSYAELDESASRLANVLQAKRRRAGRSGRHPGRFVGPGGLGDLRQPQGGGGFQPDQSLIKADKLAYVLNQLPGQGGRDSGEPAAGGR